MNIALIGCGGIGLKRAKALGAGEFRCLWAVDVDLQKAQKAAAFLKKTEATTDWKRAVEASDIDAVIIATTPDQMVPIASLALKSKKHVFLEKPAAKDVEGLLSLINLSESNQCCIRVGFNHRFHPAFLKAKAMIESNEIGPLMFIRAHYGHGGRLGYEKEWRFDPNLSGGGELLDQGSHLIDLSRWFLGDFSSVDGHLATYFWPSDVEDNAFLNLRTSQDQTAWLHASWTEWKNQFSFEIFGRTGKLHIEGLGGSYGVERLVFYKMLPEMGPPKIQEWKFEGPDTSWELELQEFQKDIALGKEPDPGLKDALAVMNIVQTIYQKDSQRQNV